MSIGSGGFNDFPISEEISIEQLLYLLDKGRELEFVYQDKEYFISNSQEGRALWTGKIRLSDFYNESHKEFVDLTKVNGNTLADIFKNSQAKILTIY